MIVAAAMAGCASGPSAQVSKDRLDPALLAMDYRDCVDAGRDAFKDCMQKRGYRVEE